MTGQDLLDAFNYIIFVIIIICTPALIATLIRKYLAKPDPNPNIAINIIIPPLIYIAGFFICWGASIYVSWDGAKKIEHLIIHPLSNAIIPATYAALVGGATAIFSIPLSRNIKLAEHHAYIFTISALSMAAVMFFVHIYQINYTPRTESPINKAQTHLGHQQHDAPIGKSAHERNIQFDKMLTQAEQRYSPLNPSSPNYNQYLIDEIESKIIKYESQGIPAPSALRRAIKESTGVEIFIPPVTNE